MSNAIGQSATQLAVSPNGEESFSFTDCVKRNGERSAKGITRERVLLNRDKLITACCADYRMHFPAIYGKTERLPRPIFDKIEEAVDAFLELHMSKVNALNVIGMRRSFFHNFRQMEVTERVQLLGENKLALKEQLFGVNLFINAAEKRLTELERKPTPNYDLEKATRQRIMQMNLTREYIKGELARQEKLAAEAATPEEKKS